MTPGFVLPLFVKAGLGNQLYVQEIGPGDTIKHFEPIDSGEAAISRHESEIARCAGEGALWGFQWDDEACVIAERPVLHAAIGAREEELPPIVRLQAATLFTSADLADHIAQAHRSLENMAPGSGGLWRDLVILLPRVRQLIFRSRAADDGRFLADIDAIDLVTKDDVLHIVIPDNLINGVGGADELNRVLSPLRPICAALDVARIQIERSYVPAPREAPRPGLSTRALAIIHCSDGADGNPAQDLRDVCHLYQHDLLSPGGELDRERLPSTDTMALLVVQDTPDAIAAATAVGAALTDSEALASAIIKPRPAPTAAGERVPWQSFRADRFEELAKYCRWIGFTGEIAETEGHTSLTPHSNLHRDRQAEDVARWTAHAVRACLAAGEEGRQALEVLHALPGRSRVVSITTMSSRGATAATLATRGVLGASRRMDWPALTAEQIVLVAFHNRALGGETRDAIEHSARRWNPSAKVIVVEERREDMVKRVRVVAFSYGRRGGGGSSNYRTGWEAYVPPAQFMPLVRSGWLVRQNPFGGMSTIHSIERWRRPYVLRYEPEMIVTLDTVEDIIAATPMHHGPIALLVQRIDDDRAVEYLLTAGIFCAIIADPRTFERFGDAPGEAVRSALATLDRSQICARLGRLAGHHALAGLQRLAFDYRLDASFYARWDAYNSEPRLERFELHRSGRDGHLYFRGIVRLDPIRKDTPRLVYRFGLMLDRDGFRLTRLTAVEGEFDLRIDNRRRLNEDYYQRRGRVRRRDDEDDQPGIPDLFEEP